MASKYLRIKTLINILLFFFCVSNLNLNAQNINTDSTTYKYKITAFIIPSTLIIYGFIGMENHKIKFINTETKEEVKEYTNENTRIDDISQHFGHGSVYLLNTLGIKGENNFKNRTLILGTSFLIMSGTVVSLKNITNVQRPDGSSTNSFPSGHTATAFMGAEFLYQEYKHKTPIYGIVGYFVATSTGLFRVYNNRHWITDIATGAGIGILSTKIAYLISPYTKKIFTKKKQKFNETSNLIIYPFYTNDKLSLGLSLTF